MFIELCFHPPGNEYNQICKEPLPFVKKLQARGANRIPEHTTIVLPVEGYKQTGIEIVKPGQRICATYTDRAGYTYRGFRLRMVESAELNVRSDHQSLPRRLVVATCLPVPNGSEKNRGYGRIGGEP